MAMRRRRVVLFVGAITLAILLATTGAYWCSRWARDREFEAIRSRTELWGGGISRLVDFNSPLYPLRNRIGRTVIDPLLGTNGCAVWTRKPDVTKEQIRELVSSVSPIRSLSIAPTSHFDDDGLIGLRDPAAVLGLHLNGMNVTDRSLATMARMENLSSLSLVETSISDDAVDRLLKLPKLNDFHVGGPNIHAVRLVDSGVFDDSGQRAVKAGGPLHVKGRIAIENRYGKPGNVRVFVRREDDPPPWLSYPYGWNAKRGNVGMLVEEAPGTWTFDVTVGGIPPGKSSVEVWVDKHPYARPNFIRYRLMPFSIELVPEEEAGDAVSEPGPVR
jgi:hypothetical protein